MNYFKDKGVLDKKKKNYFKKKMIKSFLSFFKIFTEFFFSLKNIIKKCLKITKKYMKKHCKPLKKW